MTPQNSPHLGRRLGRDPILWGLALWSAVAVTLLVVLRAEPHRQAQVLWAAQPPMDLVFLWYSWRVQAGAPGGPIRRFWRVLTGATVLFLAGDSFQTAQVLLHPASAVAAAGPVQSSLLAIGELAVVVTMLAHPLGDRGSRKRLALWLDSATVTRSATRCWSRSRSGCGTPYGEMSLSPGSAVTNSRCCCRAPPRRRPRRSPGGSWPS